MKMELTRLAIFIEMSSRLRRPKTICNLSSKQNKLQFLMSDLSIEEKKQKTLEYERIKARQFA